jgi:urease accessory protein UreF
MKLPLLQIGDSALPVGGYSHSWGLEAAVARGAVRDAPTLERWVRSWLRHAAGPCEGVVVAAACRAAQAQGLTPGMALTQARVLLPGLEVREADPAADAALLRRFLGVS